MTQDDILSSLWIEKYRPKKISDVALSPAYREKFEGFMQAGIIPHLLFEGPPGSGKTTVCKIFIESMNCESLMLNASDERGIGVVREKIKTFAQMATYKKFKIVFLDEADACTVDAQNSLKGIIEQYSAVTRFMLTCNTVSNIIEPIRQSRCQLFHFDAMPKHEVSGILKSILGKEKIGFDPKDIDKHVDMCYPDLRKAINMMQQNIRSGRFVYTDDTDIFRTLIDLLKKKDIKEIMKLLVSKRGVSFIGIYRWIYDNIDTFEKGSSRLHILLLAAEYMWRDRDVADKEMNFVAFCVKVTQHL